MAPRSLICLVFHLALQTGNVFGSQPHIIGTSHPNPGIQNANSLSNPNCAWNASSPLISADTSSYIDSLIDRWNSTGLAVAVVQKLLPTTNSSIPQWKIEYGSYGLAKTSPSTLRGKGADVITPDTLFSIASNSKLFLAISVGLLISNETLGESFQAQTGKKLEWWTKMRDLMPEEWIFEDEDIERGATIQDLLSHRTGMPRHDLSPRRKTQDVREIVSSFRHLRTSASFRQTFQYNNMMYETLSYLPTLLLNQSYESYVQQHLFNPLNMTSTTFSVQRAEGELGAHLAEGHLQHLRDMTRNEQGYLKPIVPYFSRPGEEKFWAGAGGVISSARDLSTWVAMLLNEGRHPFTNEVVVPAEVIEFVSTGLVTTHGKPEFPETSVKVYGAGQWRYSYQGYDIIEHGGNNPGFKTQVARFPAATVPEEVSPDGDSCIKTKNHGLGIISLSNDGEKGGLVLEAAKFRIADDVLGLKKVDWAPRYQKLWNDYLNSLRKNGTSPSVDPKPPLSSFESLGKKKFSHPAYGTLIPCLVPESTTYLTSTTKERNPQTPFSVMTSKYDNPHTNCTRVLSLPSSKRVLEKSPLDRPTYLIQWDRTFGSIQRLTHFDGNLFNATVAWSNADTRRNEGLSPNTLESSEDDGDILIEMDRNFEVEWVSSRGGDSVADGNEEEGLSFRGNFWGKEGPHSQEPPEGMGKSSAEVWFKAM